MTTLKARNLSLGDVHRLLGIQPLYNGSFAPLLTLEPITETEQQELDRIQDEFRTYWAEGKVLEGQVRLVAVAPLLRLAGFNRPPIKLKVEEEINRIYIEDEDTHITGRFDIVAVNKEQPTGNSMPLWVLVVESKNSEVDVSTGLPQLLTYAFNSLERQESVWGLTTNGKLNEFVYIHQGNPPTYQFMPILNFFERDRTIQLLQVLKAIGKL
jgi:hypothetical protein